jgi:arylsulfatase A-like enzyme
MKINEPMHRRTFTKLALSTAAAAVASDSFGKSNKTSKPNVLFIMADDLGYGDLSCFGRPDYETPVLDKLASEGIRLTDTYSNSASCSPTRTALLTGRYQYRIRAGLEEPIANETVGIPGTQATIASMFRDAGYTTALVGKWHLGAAPDYGPIKNGYEHFFGFYPGGLDYFAHKIKHGKVNFGGELKSDGLWRDDKEPVTAEGYLTDVLADETQRYLEAFANENEPFFLSLHFNAPHWPWEGPNDVRHSRDLTSVLDTDSGSAKVYGEMVKSLDANVGRILKTLKKLKLDKDTIIVFTSDNGGERYSYNWPFLGKKGELLEGGIRVPGIVRWPSMIKKGSESSQVITSMDWMPTLLAAAGIQAPDKLALDGLNLLPALIDSDTRIPRDMYWRYKAEEQAAVRSGHWKYLKIKNKEYLFNLEQDQREQANFKNLHPEIFKQLKEKFASWNEGMLPYPSDSFSHGGKGVYTDRY